MSTSLGDYVLSGINRSLRIAWIRLDQPYNRPVPLTSYPFTLLQAIFFNFADCLTVDGKVIVNNQLACIKPEPIQPCFLDPTSEIHWLPIAGEVSQTSVNRIQKFAACLKFRWAT